MGLIDFRKIVGGIESLVAQVALPDEVRSALAVARELMERGNAAEAARVVEPLVAKHPKLSEPCLFLGLARERCGEFPQAVEAFEFALKRGARPEEVLPALGRAREALGDLKGAEDAYHEASRFAADDVEVQLGLARVALWAGAWERAAAILKRCDAAGSAEVALLAATADFHLGRFDAVVRRARSVESAQASLRVWEARALFAQGDASEALRVFQSVSASARDEESRVAALLGEAKALATVARRDEAEACARRARALDGCRETVAWLAEMSEPAVALPLYEEALSLPAVVRRPWDPMPPGEDAAGLHLAAVRAALAMGDVARGAGHLDEAMKLGATAKATLALEARFADRRGDNEVAYEKWTRHFDATGETSSLIAAGQSALRATRIDAARDALERAASLSPAAPGLKEALRRLYATTSPVGADTLDAACRHFREIAIRTDDAAAAEAALHLVAALGQPLTLAVMGEFSSGKSTFVNALLGAEVLPVGVTPTTATVNVIRYGAERAARVVRNDGRVEPIGWDELPAAIDRRLGADPRSIREVEIDWPAPELRDVSILDTPGFNAVAEGHEARAAELLQRADAVVWLFDAGQAGRASEAEPLDRLAALGVRVLGVVNKADRLAATDVEKVLDVAQRVAPAAVARVLPFSAKRALAARVGGDAGALAAAGFETLRRTLGDEFFSHARALKRSVVERRLIAAVKASRDRLSAREANSAARRAKVREAESVVAALRAELDTELVDGLLADLREGLARALREVARDAARFVEPATPFRGPRLRDDSVGVVAAGFASLTLGAVDAAAARAREKLDRSLSLSDEAWHGQLPSEADDLFRRLGNLARELFLSKTVERFRGEVRALAEGRAAEAVLRAAVDESKGNADDLATALQAALPPLGGWLRDALKSGVSEVAAAFQAPAQALVRGIDRETLMLQTSWSEPLAEVERHLKNGFCPW